MYFIELLRPPDEFLVVSVRCLWWRRLWRTRWATTLAWSTTRRPASVPTSGASCPPRPGTGPSPNTASPAINIACIAVCACCVKRWPPVSLPQSPSRLRQPVRSMIGVREPVNVSSSDRRQLEPKPADGSSCTGPSPRTMRYPSLSVRDQSDNWKTTWYDRRDFRSTECSNVLPVSGMHGLVWYDCIFTQVYIFISWPVLVKSHASGWDAMLNTNTNTNTNPN